ncbi:olfactory receptor 10A2-like [Mantella aurantiaca]
MALTSNVLVIMLVVANKSLHSPMYFFLSQLSLSEILFTSNIVPSMLWLMLIGSGRISVDRCISQFLLLAIPSVTQCLLLAGMSFDRYVAICKPLHYATIVTIECQLQIILSCWSVGFILSLVVYIFLKQLKFCGLNTINHFFCDIAPLIRLSCSDTYFVEMATAAVSFPVVLSPFMLIVVTYISILQAILKISSTTGRKKTFSTCSSHLIIVCMYYGTLSSIYIFPPKENSVDVNKSLSLLYTLVTPLFNPLVYSLRNQDIKAAIQKSIKIMTLHKFTIPSPPITMGDGMCYDNKALLILRFPEGFFALIFMKNTNGSSFYLEYIRVFIQEEDGTSIHEYTSLEALVTPLGQTCNRNIVKLEVSPNVTVVLMDLEVKIFELGEDNVRRDDESTFFVYGKKFINAISILTNYYFNLKYVYKLVFAFF